MAERIVLGKPEVIGWQKRLSDVYHMELNCSKDSQKSTRGSWMVVRIV